MTDLDIIKQLEQEIGKELGILEDIAWNSVGFKINFQKQITHLSLYECEILQVPNCLFSLTYLQNLFLINNKIEELSANLGQLKYLNYLDLQYNQLKTLPESIQQLKYLGYLDLQYNQLKNLPESVGQLQNLTYLNLQHNQLQKLPESIGQLQKLTSLNIRKNQLKKLPKSIEQLQNLYSLDIRYNQLEELPKNSGQLQKLVYLELSNNFLQKLPESIGQLHNLTYLDLEKNQLKELPENIGQLKNLSKLYLSHNHIKELPISLGKIKNPYQLFIYQNPLEKPPMEIVEKGVFAINNYFKSLQQEYPLNEIKILLIGDGGAGKTSIAKQLLNQTFNPYESQTHGINIKPHTIKTKNKQGKNTEVIGHLWDFGGQEVMHATHQFFLSKRSLYILVLDGRKEEKAEYWLKHIENFGDDSPVLVVLNKMDQNPKFELNQPFLCEKYQGIHSFHPVSCKNATGIEPLKQAISEALSEIEILQTVWGKNWFEIKTMLENLAQHYISHESYIDLCNKRNVTGSAQDILVQFLHDLGIIIHFKDFDLRDTYVLEPKWVTEAVYKIINAPQLIDSQGILKLNCLDKILQPQNEYDYTYPLDKHRYIILLMRKFELCYKINSETILIPDLLPIVQPKFEFDYDNALKFKIKYDFLPRSIMPKLIVKQHTDILNQIQWRTGVLLYDKAYQATAIIKADNEDKNIQIWVMGQQKRDYFAAIRKTLWDIHKQFEKLGVVELIPLPDKDKKGQTIYVEYEQLIGYYLENIDIYFDGKLRKKYNVKQLLDGFESIQLPEKNSVTIQNYGTISGTNINTGDNSLQQHS
ncbi:COR domain-containing protein [Candidatus Albibeggiatoa sp. nov. NOAA]|uniref:COR domain-containing protein n=1 Tax=Candidatus Albibeggiatoa sp. nov. NOAA TaxID=3162724 RepID=UPI0032FFB991|nr:GTP-binding protein [Thiotrichaceae bacterium]